MLRNEITRVRGTLRKIKMSQNGKHVLTVKEHIDTYRRKKWKMRKNRKEEGMACKASHAALDYYKLSPKKYVLKNNY